MKDRKTMIGYDYFGDTVLDDNGDLRHLLDSSVKYEGEVDVHVERPFLLKDKDGTDKTFKFGKGVKVIYSGPIDIELFMCENDHFDNKLVIDGLNMSGINAEMIHSVNVE